MFWLTVVSRIPGWLHTLFVTEDESLPLRPENEITAMYHLVYIQGQESNWGLCAN